jgi:hypothetical protein
MEACGIMENPCDVVGRYIEEVSMSTLNVTNPWIRDVRWADWQVMVEFNRQAIKAAPPYDFTKALNRVRESGLFEYCGRRGHWPAGAA